jgi:hypothetical protein
MVTVGGNLYLRGKANHQRQNPWDQSRNETSSTPKGWEASIDFSPWNNAKVGAFVGQETTRDMYTASGQSFKVTTTQV